jgi:hypothetical protein
MNTTFKRNLFVSVLALFVFILSFYINSFMDVMRFSYLLFRTYMLFAEAIFLATFVSGLVLYALVEVYHKDLKANFFYLLSGVFNIGIGCLFAFIFFMTIVNPDSHDLRANVNSPLNLLIFELLIVGFAMCRKAYKANKKAAGLSLE